MIQIDGQLLRELEAKCTREQPPPIVAACPLHIDCRSICDYISAGDFDKARSVYEASSVFPTILCNTCDEQCKFKCAFGEKAAIQMRMLEWACMQYGKPSRRSPFLPKKTQTMAIIGAGLAGLAAASELGKKGYHITVYEKSDILWGSMSSVLPDILLKQEEERLSAYNITFNLGESISYGDISSLSQKYDCVLIAWGDFQGIKVKDPVSLQTDEFGVDNVFAAGMAVSAADISTSEAISYGKRSAVSMFRYLQKTSLVSGRERELSFDTDAHALSDVEKPDSLPDKLTVSSQKEDFIKEAERCPGCACDKCIKACAFMRHYKSYPRKYLREIYNNLAIAMGTHHANKLINSCSLCGQCAKVCPNGLDLGDYVLKARQIMVEKGKMPQSAFEFATNDMEYSNSDDIFLCRQDPLTDTCKYVYFPGCQLGASTPDIVEKSYADLRNILDGGVSLILGCCSVMAKWSGEQKLFLENIDKIKKAWESLGRPTLIAACPTCMDTLSKEIEGMSCIGIWDVLLNHKQITPKDTKTTLCVHDACGARNDGTVSANIRKLTVKLGYEITEGSYSGEKSGCCGYGGLMQYSNPPLSDDMTEQCIDGYEGSFLTYCINCRDRMLKQGADAYHILELIYGDDSTPHKWPSYSMRRQNRYELRQNLLRDVWGEKIIKHVKPNITYSDELAVLMEERKILEDDITGVILEAEKEKNYILDSSKGERISHKQIGNVTFWVYYTLENEIYTIKRVYSHRMRIL